MSRQRKPMAMASILDTCGGAQRQDFAPGTILLSEGETSGRLYVLAEGTVEVLRGDTQVAIIKGAGSIFGEMSVLSRIVYVLVGISAIVQIVPLIKAGDQR